MLMADSSHSPVPLSAFAIGCAADLRGIYFGCGLRHSRLRSRSSGCQPRLQSDALPVATQVGFAWRRVSRRTRRYSHSPLESLTHLPICGSTLYPTLTSPSSELGAGPQHVPPQKGPV